MNFTILISLLLVSLYFTDCSKFQSLPDNLILKIFEYFPVSSGSIPILRSVSREVKRLIDEYLSLELEDLRGRGFEVIVGWQLINLLPIAVKEHRNNLSIDFIKDFAYKPDLLKNHIKFLKYLSLTSSLKLKLIYEELKHDTDGFINTMKNYYEPRIHGFDKFLEIFGCEGCDEIDNSCFNLGIEMEWETEIWWFLINLLNLLQG